jgi:hypothetical protein
MLDYFGKLNQNVIDQIKYRGTILTGEITKDNDDGTYDVKISQADDPYPNVETAFYDEIFSVGEIVVVTFEDGNKERPRIWGHAKKIAQEPKIVEVDYSGEVVPAVIDYIFVVYKSDSDYCLNRYCYDGVLDSELGILSELTEDVVRMCVDSNQNIYILHQVEQSYPLPFLHTIYKYDKNGNHLLTKSLSENEMVAYISPGGYLYTLIWNTDYVTKRNLSDLELVSTHTIISGHKYRYLTFDSSGYLYTYDENYVGGKAFLKWELGVGEVTHYTKILTGLSAWSTWAVEGDYLAGHEINRNYEIAFTMPKSLSSDLTNWTLDGIKYSYDVAGIPNHFIFLGKSADNKLVLEKYNTSRTRQWSIEIASYTLTHTACAVAVYPF